MLHHSFDGSNYAFWKVRIRAFLCAIDKSVRAALALANANSKAINAIFYDVFTDEFHRISHVEIAKETWMILETTYEGTLKVKDTKLQMLTNISNIKYFIFLPFI